MNWLNQTLAVTIQNLRSIPRRLGSASVTVVGVAGVVAVFVSVLSMAEGFRKTLESGGSDRNAIVLRDGSSSEIDSGLSAEQVRIIRNAPGVARDGDGPVVSAELFVVVDLPKRSTGTDANVPLRGTEPEAAKIREQFAIVDGRMFEPGRNELIAGRGAASQFEGLAVGSELRFGQSTWDVVGIFEAGGGIAESELWGDVKVIQPAYRRGSSYNAVYARLESMDSLAAFEAALDSDPRLAVDVFLEQAFYSQQSSALTGFITSVGVAIAVLMALGATFGALNTMYTAISERNREIATLKAIGFSGGPIVVSVMVEAILLALLGGLAGGALAYLAFNGFTVSTLNFTGFSQVVFAFAVTPRLLFQGISIALAIGVLGGLFPAIAAARRTISTALRAA